MLRIEYFASGRGEGPAAGGGSRRRRWRTHIVGLLGVAACQVAHADPSIVLPNGLPVQVVPTFQEPGLPAFSFPDGSGLAVGGSGSGSDSGSGSGDGASGEAYDTMMAQAWGNQAVDAANAMGVNAAALAATCVMESNCQNVGASGGGSAAGVFQMISSTYTADINGALAYDPSIAGNIVSGLAGQMDPGTEAYAAAYELQQDAQLLQGNGVSNPTVLGVRAVYQFGSGVGPSVAAAQDSANLESIVNLSAASLAANGLTASSTVGQWRAMQVQKLGSDAYQTVLAGGQ